MKKQGDFKDQMGIDEMDKPYHHSSSQSPTSEHIHQSPQMEALTIALATQSYSIQDCKPLPVDGKTFFVDMEQHKNLFRDFYSVANNTNAMIPKGALKQRQMIYLLLNIEKAELQYAAHISWTNKDVLFVLYMEGIEAGTVALEKGHGLCKMVMGTESDWQSNENAEHGAAAGV